MSYVSTVIASSKLSPKFLAEYKAIFQAHDILIKSQNVLSQDKVIDYFFEVQKDQAEALKQELFDLSKKIPSSSGEYVDIIFQKNSQARKTKGLVVFDMDSTLIQQEVIDMIAAYANVEDQVSKITEAAMNGEIDFNESLKRRVALLKGIDDSVFEKLKTKISFTPGAKILCKGLKNSGSKLAVLSGGFIPLAEWVKGELGLDYAYANNLQVDNEHKLTGETYGRVINNVAKSDLLKEIAEKENVPIEATIAIGDGSNDLLMMASAGFGIAFNAKPIVQLKAPSKINTRTLETVFYVLGYTDQEIEKLVS